MNPTRETCSKYVLVRVHSSIKESFPPPDSQVTLENQIDRHQLQNAIERSLYQGVPKDLIIGYRDYPYSIFFQIWNIIEKCMSVIFGMQALRGVINWGEAATIIEGVIHREIRYRIYINGSKDAIWEAVDWMLKNGWGREWGKQEEE